MKTYSSPPAIVELVMGAVCILFKKKYTWNDSKILMGNVNKFKESLVNFEKDQITDKVIKQLKAHISHPDFVPDSIREKVGPAGDLATWVCAMDKFFDVNKVVEPKKKKV